MCNFIPDPFKVMIKRPRACALSQLGAGTERGSKPSFPPDITNVIRTTLWMRFCVLGLKLNVNVQPILNSYTVQPVKSHQTTCLKNNNDLKTILKR